MKKLFFLFLALVATTSLWAYDFQSGDLYYNITSDVEPYTVEVTYHSSSYPYNEGVAITTATIPETVTYNGTTYSVTSIGNYAFLECSSLDTLTCLAMTLPALGEDVFYRCDNPTLFVPCAALSKYQLHEQWGKFTTIECIASEEVETEEVIIESNTTTVTVTWPTEDGADTYTIVIKKDGEVVWRALKKSPI